MQLKLWRARGNELLDITPITDQITWRSNKDELGVELNFGNAFGDAIHNPKKQVNLGDMVILKDGNREVTRCIVVDEDITGRQPIPFTAFDLAYYLNESKRVYQFNSISADQAIKRICSDYNVPIYYIVKIPTKIDKIYMNDTLSDIIKDVLLQAEADQGIHYQFEMFEGKFHVYRSKDIMIVPRHHNGLIYAPNGTDVMQAPSRKRTIKGMKNSIQVTSDGQVLASERNNALIQSYGLLSEIVDVQEEDRPRARNIARNTLKELGRVFEENSLNMLGDSRVLAGRLIEITEPITGMKGQYMIESVQHTAQNGIHMMSLDLSMKGVS
ncbi:XkdQ/YqbQ family protein [Bacillus sp. AK031]